MANMAIYLLSFLSVFSVFYQLLKSISVHVLLNIVLTFGVYSAQKEILILNYFNIIIICISRHRYLHEI